MNGLILELTNELKTNPEIKDSAVVRVVLESINNSALLGVPSDKILETALTTLDELGAATINENIKDVVSKFKQFAQKPTQRLANMAKEAGISMKIKMLQESNIAKDPAFSYTLGQIAKMLTVNPEFRMFGTIFEALNQYSYDPGVAKVLTDLNEYVNTNRPKLELLNAIFEMRQASSLLYNDAIIILEESLLKEEFGADSIKMKMRGRVDLPIVNRLVNTLSMVEAKDHGKFNIGLGNGDAKVKAVIAPFHKISESAAIILIDNAFVKLTEDNDPTPVTLEEAQAFPEFYAVCEAFAKLNFQERDGEIYARGRNLEIAFAVNETGNLQLKINGKTIDDLTKMDLSQVFLMEQMDTRSQLVKVFNALDIIVNLEFAKKIINERLDKDSIVFTIGENIFVFEKLGQTRVIKKMQGLAFHNYVMENFQYDVSDLYAIELGEHDEAIKRIDEEKKLVERDIEKLEASIKNLDEALAGSVLTDDQKISMNDLRISIEKNVNGLKNHYISLDQAKKKA
jgi:hypothetical protein